MSAAVSEATVHDLPNDPPLFRAQLLKNKRRGRAVAKILAEFEQSELNEIEREAKADVDWGWESSS